MIFDPSEPQRLIQQHLRTHEKALLYVGMGIGKTGACLAEVSAKLLEADIKAVLVIAPLRVGTLTWPMECEQFEQFRWLKIVHLRNAVKTSLWNKEITVFTKKAVETRNEFFEGRAHIYIINYDSIPVLTGLVYQLEGRPLPFDLVIFDEITKAKNPGSKRINLYRKKVPPVKYQWGLTGTPAPNSLLDLFAPARLVDGGKRLGDSFTKYRHTYFKKQDYLGYDWKERVGAEKGIEEKLSDITLTLKSSDWLNLPDTVVEDVEIKLPDELRRQYEILQDEFVFQFSEGHEMNVANSAALINKLLQFTSGAIYDEEKVWHPIHTLKIDALKKLAKENPNPLLVSCVFRHEQDRIRTAFPHALFFDDAKTPDAQRTLLEAWNLGAISMLVAHPASVGHGLNLQHGGSTIVWFSLTYSRELYEQMIARLARRGQTDVVRVFRLMMMGTVDEVVAEALAMKADTEQRLLMALKMLEQMRELM